MVAAMNSTRRRSLLGPIIAMAAILAASCGTSAGGDAAADGESTSVPPSSDEPGTTSAIDAVSVGSGSIDQGLWPFIDLAVADLTERLNIPAGDITVEQASLTIWSDGSLGCPEPKMVYTQGETDGSVIELRAAGATWWYHSGGTKTPFLCESLLRTPAR